jgi:hypothetical protein
VQKGEEMLRIAFVTLALISSITHASTYVWPDSTGICAHSLQDCVNNVGNDDTVKVTTQSVDIGTPKLTISKPIHLTAAFGVRPVFVAGQSIEASYSTTGTQSWSLSIEGLSFLDGAVHVAANGGTATISLRNLDVTSIQNSNYASIGVDVSGGTAQYDISNNKITTSIASGRAALTASVLSNTPGSAGAIHDNRIFGNGPNGNTGISLIGIIDGTRVYANQLCGNFSIAIDVNASTTITANHSAALISNAITCATPRTNATSGIRSNSGTTTSTINLQILNNTIANCLNGYLTRFNTNWSGRVTNNLFYDDVVSIDAGADDAPLPNDHNLFWNDSFHSFREGDDTYHIDPKLVRGSNDSRLTLGSPAIDAGNSDALSTALNALHVREVDADGSRRFKGEGSSPSVDIGAFEFGDAALSLFADADAVANVPQLNRDPVAAPLVIQNQNPDTYDTVYTQSGNIGLALNESNLFEVIAESNGKSPLPETGYNVFAPAPGAGVLEHTTTAANTLNFTTLIDDPYLDGHPERIVLASHQGPPRFNNTFGLAFSAADDKWSLQQTDVTGAATSMPTGLMFDVYAQDSSVNAFVLTAVPNSVSAYARIDSIVSNGEPCASIFVANSTLNAHPIALQFLYPYWYFFNTDGQAIDPGTPFYVVVDEAATQSCRYDHIFHDGFENLTVS